MIVLGIDPGYERLGIAIVSKEIGRDRSNPSRQAKETLTYSACFKTSSKKSFEERLLEIGIEIERIISEYQPKALSIENLFLSTNQKTAMHVSEVRGVILYLAANNHMNIKEFTPLQIKLAVSGHGRSDKNSMIKMIHRLVEISQKIAHDDEYDAIAAALTYFAYNPVR